MRLLAQARDRLGAPALGALALFVLGFAFLMSAVQPLERENRALDLRLGGLRAAARTHPGERAPSAKLDRFYRFFDRGVEIVDWLARIYGAGKAAGIELRTADYQMLDSRERLQRYRIVLPVSGGFAQIRDFAERALEEIPVLSLDQISFRRQRAADARVEAEIVMTLHLPRP